MEVLSSAQSAPGRIGRSDVARLTARTDALRAVDYRRGGRSCLDDVRTLLHHAHRMFEAEAADLVRAPLWAAVADLHNLAGWACFDAGLATRARLHFSRALSLAGCGRDDRLVADVFYRLGRLHLHYDGPGQALEYFQFGRRSAARPGCEAAASILAVNQARAHAVMGAENRATALLRQSRDMFGAADHTDPPSWSRYFTETGLSAMTGTVHTELAARVDPRHALAAIPALTEATDGFGDEMARSRALALVQLATSYLIDGELDHAVDAGFRALSHAENLTSVRVRDRVRLLGKRAEQHDHHAGARELAMRISTFTDASAETGRRGSS